VPETPPAKAAPEADKRAKSTRPLSRPLSRPLPRPQPVAPVKRAEPAIEHGRAAGVDRRSAERLRRGRLPVEARLDLHGHTQDQAHAALDHFLGEAQARGLRCVLVITGKGTTTGAAVGAGGVLRGQVPRWLNEPGNRARVLAFDYAQPKHGGLGALYVLMRRRKG
jgi:DNA-nicking Smr family endonuclease